MINNKNNIKLHLENGMCIGGYSPLCLRIEGIGELLPANATIDILVELKAQNKPITQYMTRNRKVILEYEGIKKEVQIVKNKTVKLQGMKKILCVVTVREYTEYAGGGIVGF